MSQSRKDLDAQEEAPQHVKELSNGRNTSKILNGKTKDVSDAL